MRAANPGSSLLALLFILLSCLATAGSAFANEAHLILVAGEVQLQRAAGSGPVQVLVPVSGTMVQTGDTLITGINGRVQLRFTDGSLISLQPRSEFRIDDYRFDMQQQRGFFSLVRGALRTISGAVGKRDPDDYRMTTPTATIGIRGTEYLLEQTTCTPVCYPGRTAGTRVSVNSGFVVVFNPAGSIELPAGGATYVPSAVRPPVYTIERPTMSAAPVAADPVASAAPATAAGTRRPADTTPGPIAARSSDEAGGNGRSAGAKDGTDKTSETGGGRRTGAGDGARRDARASAGAEVDTRAASAAQTAQVAERRGRLMVADGEGVPAALLERWNTREQPRDEPRTSPAPGGLHAGSDTPTSVVRPAAVPSYAQENAGRTDPAGRDAAITGTAGAPSDAAAGSAHPPFESATTPGAAATPIGVSTLPPPAEPLTSPLPVGAGMATGMSTTALQAVAAQTAYSESNAPPVGDAVATNAQRDTAGSTVAVAAVVPGGGTGPADGKPPCPPADACAADPGTGAGTGGTGGVPPVADPGITPPATPIEPGIDPGTGPVGIPEPLPGFSNGDLMAILLQSHQITPDLIPSNAAVGLDAGYRLDSIGSCPLLACLTRNTAQVVDAGYNSDVSWGRWVSGTARLTSPSGTVDLELGDNNGIHYLIGVPTASMPVSGSAYYALAGATSPTFSSGALAPGTFTGEGLVSFGSGMATRVGLTGDVVFGSGEHYRLSSNGVRDGAGRLVEVGNSQLQMTGANTFGGNIDVASQGSSDRLDCAGGKCQATVQGGFYGRDAARLGIGYSVGRIAPVGGSDTIRGVAVMNRQ